MTKIRCIAVDDEQYAINMIADYIAKVPYLELVGSTTNPIEALTIIQRGEVDLVFLDIQMPELTGLQFLKLCGDKCRVILTTAYAEYALDGFEHGVIDYLLKPIAFDRFLKAAQKAFDQFSGAKQVAHKPSPEPAAPAIVNADQSYIFIKGDSKSKFLKVDHSDILYIQGLKNYISIFTTAQRIVTYQSLREISDLLPQPPFYRVHKSYIISIAKMRMIDGNTVYIGDQQIPVGESYQESFFKIIKDRP